MRIIRIGPGEVAMSEAGHELRTLLGSCVAITLWHPQRRIAAMCHIVLPARHLPPGKRGLDGRFADEAWVKMGMLLATHGLSPAECICKIFGGARVFAHEFANMGGRNVESVRELLHGCGIEIAREHVGGVGHRELRLDVATGDAWIRHRKVQMAGDGTRMSA